MILTEEALSTPAAVENNLEEEIRLVVWIRHSFDAPDTGTTLVR